MKIGTAEVAKQALKINTDYEYALNFGHPFKKPVGWRRIGSGSTRRAWLAPDKIVYKVQTYDGLGEGYKSPNQNEHRNLKLLKNLVSPLYKIPESYLYCDDKVIAMTYVRQDKISYNFDHMTERKYSEWHKFNQCDIENCYGRVGAELEQLGLLDFHSDNVLVGADGFIWIVDAADFVSVGLTTD